MSTEKPTTDSYLVPALKTDEIHRTELTVKKSRFITSTSRCAGVDACKSFIAKITAEFSDARHNCFAYNGGKPNSSGFAGCSDDGEPHGTAGQPMLNVLLHCGTGEICCVVTRYFGGILLGTGGLVKAYQDSIKLNLESLKVLQKVETVSFKVVLQHSLFGIFNKLCAECGVVVSDAVYGAALEVKIEVPKDSEDFFLGRLRSICSGDPNIHRI